MPLERGERVRDHAVRGIRVESVDTPAHEHPHPVPDETGDGLGRKTAETRTLQSGVYRCREVVERVDERPVEVEDDQGMAEIDGSQTEKEEPQPQVRSAFGFVNLKPAPCSPSAKSTTVPSSH